MQIEPARKLAVADAVSGMKRLRAVADGEPAEKAIALLDEISVKELTDLLTAIMQRERWSDAEFNKIFDDDKDPISIGFEVVGMLCRGGAISTLPEVLRFFHWLIAEDEEEWLLDVGQSSLAASSFEVAIAWIALVAEANLIDEVAGVIIRGLQELAMKTSSVSQAVRPQVIAALQESQKFSVRTTTDLMYLAVALKFDEAAEAIEIAFSENRIDCGMMGDWEIVRKELHVEGRGLPMPQKPYNSMDDFRRKVGVGCFSKKAVFLSGEIQEDAVEPYLQTACEAFSRSPEGREVLADTEEPYHVRQFLELGVQQLGVTTETMTVADATELLLEIFPQKVTMDVANCDRVTAELAAFWKFCERAHQLELAASIAARIAALSKRFRSAMSDPANFGMAKSFATMGQQAGFDMTSQAGMNKFMIAYNASISRKSRPLQGTNRRVDSVADNTSHVPLDRKQRKKLLAKKQKVKSQNKK